MAAAPYAAIDSAIREWVEKHRFTLFDSAEGFPEEDFRSVYLSSDRGECFQIWIDPPESGEVSLHAADVETRLDEEFHHDWRVPVPQLAAALEVAVAHVKGWMNRNG
jgi:hypothetical protein